MTKQNTKGSEVREGKLLCEKFARDKMEKVSFAVRLKLMLLGAFLCE